MEPRLKNAAAPAVQASAWLVGEGGGTILTRAAEWAAEKHDQGVEVTPLYAHRALPDPSAVQPAAGREADRKALLSALPAIIRHYTASPSQQTLEEALERILAALAHPPAQGSESGGEAWRVENDGQTVKFWVGNQGFTVASLEGDDDEPGYLPLMEKLLKKALAALSQPGPASEGDGE